MEMFIIALLIVIGLGAQTLIQEQERTITIVVEFSEDKQC